MKIATLVSSIDPAVGGGVAESVIKLNRYLIKNSDVSAEIFSLKHPNSKIDLISGVETRLHKFYDPWLYGFSPGLKKDVLHSKADLLHVHGMWEYNSIISLSWKKKGRKYIVSIQGMLNPWAMNNSKIKKKIVYNLLDKKYVRNAAVLHAVNYNEYKSIRNLGLNNLVCILPNGVDLNDFNLLDKTKKNSYTEKKILLFFGRIHPVKGVMNLLKAIHLLKINKEKFLQDWFLVIAGWGRKQHVDMFKNYIISYNISEYVKYIGPLFGEEKYSMHRVADAFILPSMNEGLPIAVLEAWAFGLPVLITPDCHLPEGVANNAAIEVFSEPESIAQGLKKISSISKDDLMDMGENGRQLVVNKYNWTNIANGMKEIYEWVLGYREKPQTVILK